MDRDSKLNAGSDRGLDEAVGWHLRLAAANAGEDAFLEFLAWLERDPANRLAYGKVEDFDRTLGSVISQQQQQQHLWRAAIPYLPREAKSAPFAKWVIGAAAIAAAFLIVFFVNTSAPPTTHYVTGIGQSRTVLLSDGSKIEMNTATSLSVQVDSDGRLVTVERGEAAFRVRHEQARPFIVHVGDLDVRDVGTVFDISDHDGRISIAVADGQVAVTQAGRGNPIILRTGERLRYTERNKSSALDHVDPRWVTAWQSGYLVYRNAPLGEVVADLNRYFRKPITVEQDAASGKHFSGVLRIIDEDTAVAQLTAFLPIIAVHEARGTIRLQSVKAKS